MALPEQERPRAISREPRFATLGLAIHLLTRPWPTEPAGAEEHARLALALAGRLRPDTYPAALVWDARGRAWALLAAARARRLEVPEAEDALAQARAALERGTGDPLEIAHLLTVEALLRRRQWRSKEAAALEHRARCLYLAAGDEAAAAALASPPNRRRGGPRPRHREATPG